MSPDELAPPPKDGGDSPQLHRDEATKEPNMETNTNPNTNTAAEAAATRTLRDMSGWEKLWILAANWDSSSRMAAMHPDSPTAKQRADDALEAWAVYAEENGLGGTEYDPIEARPEVTITDRANALIHEIRLTPESVQEFGLDRAEAKRGDLVACAWSRLVGIAEHVAEDGDDSILSAMERALAGVTLARVAAEAEVERRVPKATYVQMCEEADREMLRAEAAEAREAALRKAMEGLADEWTHEVECTCAMSESSMWACAVHGEHAPTEADHLRAALASVSAPTDEAGVSLSGQHVPACNEQCAEASHWIYATPKSPVRCDQCGSLPGECVNQDTGEWWGSCYAPRASR